MSAKNTKIKGDPSECLGTWIRGIFQVLRTDWPAYAFHIKAVNNNSEILVQFEQPPDSSVVFPPPNNALNKVRMRGGGRRIEDERGRRGEERKRRRGEDCEPETQP